MLVHMSVSAHTATSPSRYGIVAVIASAGGLPSVRKIIRALPPSLPLPITIFQHLASHRARRFAEILMARACLAVEWARAGASLRPFTAYVIRP